MSNSIVRLALVASVTWRSPPVNRQKLSMVPQASSPACPVSRHRGCRAAMRSLSRRSKDQQQTGLGGNFRLQSLFFQSCANHTGSPILPDDSVVQYLACLPVHKTVVSRWFVMPMPAIAPTSIPAVLTASRQVASVSQMTSGSCSTTGFRKICDNSRCAAAGHFRMVRKPSRVCWWFLDRLQVEGVAHVG